MKKTHLNEPNVTIGTRGDERDGAVVSVTLWGGDSIRAQIRLAPDAAESLLLSLRNAIDRARALDLPDAVPPIQALLLSDT